ncbi:IclR family transcriptional regulator [Rhizobium leguminosarum]|uniref:IclR family transcriptional regulator n=1 Tax=Rhizobium leguminosarum TaxID=384 RepID=UPI001C921640|nr:IclR family transcriptional regulator [Rhizobium leguminosarum]MBY2973079.1 IclR family transcriptional regulator [Rhizobium leguminosarum]MBY2980479.1 IclR family transcriptional regulator [Rhizobium leguminosarum]MBY3009030.1 IclR family transcriptional regulator [Rhizobium leguminosarum]
MDQDKTLQKLVPAVERAVEVLDIVAVSKRFLTVSELAREADLPKSTVHSLCLTMVQLGMLIRRPDQTFQLGPHLLRWSNAFDRQTDVATEFALLCDDMPILTEAAATLSVPEDIDMVFIASRQAAAGHRFQARPGMRVPAPFVAAGKAILSRWSDFEIRRRFADGLPKPLTENSVRSVDQLFEEIRLVRKTGFAEEVGQCIDGVTNLSAPILNALNRPLAAVMLSLPTELADAELLTEVSQTVLTLANRLSHRMGADIPDCL